MGLSLKSIGKGLKKIGKGAKKLGKNLGKAWEKVDDYVLPAAGFALGGPAGAALGSAAARGIGDGKFDAKATAGAGLKGYAMGQLGSMAGLQGGQGIGSLGSSARNLVTNPTQIGKNFLGGGAGGASQSVAAAPGAPAAAQAGGNMGGQGILRSAGEWAMKNPELIMGAVNAYQSSKQAGQANKLDERALALAEQPWNETAGLRRQSLDRLMNPQRQDLSGIYEGSSNPFSRPLRSVRRGGY